MTPHKIHFVVKGNFRALCGRSYHPVYVSAYDRMGEVTCILCREKADKLSPSTLILMQYNSDSLRIQELENRQKIMEILVK